MIAQSHRGSVILRIKSHPVGELPSPGGGRLFGENQCDNTEFGPVRVADLNAQHIAASSIDQLAELSDIAFWIEQRAKRRIADWPALHLVYLIIDEGQGLAVGYHQ